jgi:sporulation protein YlmC with PRC-barrel domain
MLLHLHSRCSSHRDEDTRVHGGKNCRAMTKRLELGKPVRCTDGVVGELRDVVIDPVRKQVTHLVVRPHNALGDARLVPVELADGGEQGREISLRCTIEEVRGLPNVEEFAYLRLGEVPLGDEAWDVGIEDVLAFPYYQSTGFGEYVGDPNVALIYDRVPKGEVEVRRASNVITADGQYVGDVDGFLLDDDDQITHFVLERGHLWGRREVTVPIGAVAKVESDTVIVSLSADEIGELPAHKVHRWPGSARRRS